MEIDEIHALLKGVGQKEGAGFDETLHWFQRCGIVDDKRLSNELFVESYERVAPNREDLTLTQFVVLMAICGRESHRKTEILTKMFLTIKEEILQEIQMNLRRREEVQNRRHTWLEEEEVKLEETGGRALQIKSVPNLQDK